MADGTVARRWAGAAAIVVAVAAVVWFGTGVMARRALAAGIPPPGQLDGVPAPVRAAVQEADAEARSAPGAATIGALGRAYHAGQLRDGALAAYAMAEALAATDATWPYLRALLLEEHGDSAARTRCGGSSSWRRRPVTRGTGWPRPSSSGAGSTRRGRPTRKRPRHRRCRPSCRPA